jgi:two-component system alkaline phosphatase synthesis response regulator PhoP
MSAFAPSRQLILVADDSMTILAMVTARLERAGYDVLTASRGDDALRLAHERHPVLVVLDVEMPGSDGIDVTRALREDTGLAHVPIVLLTSHSTPDAVENGLAAGANAYVTKPFSPQELEVAIEELLGRSPGG